MLAPLTTLVEVLALLTTFVDLFVASLEISHNISLLWLMIFNVIFLKKCSICRYKHSILLRIVK